jgi:hypothetical protein
MQLRPNLSGPELSLMKNELKLLFDDLARRKLIPGLSQAELTKAIDDLTPALLLLKNYVPEQFRQLTDEYKTILVFAFAKANQNPEFKLLKDQVMDLILTPRNELSQKPELRLTLSKLKLAIDKLMKKLEAEKKISPELALRFRKNYEDKARELEKNLTKEKTDPRPIGGDPAFSKLFLDYLTLTLIDEFNHDPRTGMYFTTIDTIIPNTGGYDDPNPSAQGNALSTLLRKTAAEENIAAQGVAPTQEKTGSSMTTPSFVRTKPPTPTGGATS